MLVYLKLLVEITPNDSAIKAIKAIKAMYNSNKRSTSVRTGVMNLYGGRSPSRTVVVPSGQGVSGLPTDPASTKIDKKMPTGMETRKTVFSCSDIREKQKALSASTEENTTPTAPKEVIILYLLSIFPTQVQRYQ